MKDSVKREVLSFVFGMFVLLFILVAGTVINNLALQGDSDLVKTSQLKNTAIEAQEDWTCLEWRNETVEKIRSSHNTTAEQFLKWLDDAPHFFVNFSGLEEDLGREKFESVGREKMGLIFYENETRLTCVREGLNCEEKQLTIYNTPIEEIMKNWKYWEARTKEEQIRVEKLEEELKYYKDNTVQLTQAENLVKQIGELESKLERVREILDHKIEELGKEESLYADGLVSFCRYLKKEVVE